MIKHSETQIKILKIGKKEFLEKGFKDASLRGIVKEAGFTRGAFYGYYSDKEALFNDLVEAVATNLYECYANTQEDLITKESPAECKNVVNSDTDSYILKMLDIVYDDFDLFKLIICCSEGTKYANYLDSLTKISIKNTYRLIDHLRNGGIHVNQVPHQLINMICSANFTAFFKVVELEIPKNEAIEYVAGLFKFYNSGWKTLLNI